LQFAMRTGVLRFERQNTSKEKKKVVIQLKDAIQKKEDRKKM